MDPARRSSWPKTYDWKESVSPTDHATTWESAVDTTVGEKSERLLNGDEILRQCSDDCQEIDCCGQEALSGPQGGSDFEGLTENTYIGHKTSVKLREDYWTRGSLWTKTYAQQAMPELPCALEIMPIEKLEARLARVWRVTMDAFGPLINFEVTIPRRTGFGSPSFAFFWHASVAYAQPLDLTLQAAVPENAQAVWDPIAITLTAAITIFSAAALFVTMRGHGTPSNWAIDILASLATSLSATWWFLAAASVHTPSSTVFTAGGSIVFWALLVAVGSKKLRWRWQFVLAVPMGTAVWLIVLLPLFDKMGFIDLGNMHKALIHVKLSGGLLVSSCWTWALFRLQEALERSMQQALQRSVRDVEMNHRSETPAERPAED